MSSLSVVRGKPSGTSYKVQSRIGRYIRGEVSAASLSRKSRPKQAEKVCANELHSPANCIRRQITPKKIENKFRPLFRNTINVKNVSFVSVVNDVKRMKINEHTSSKKLSNPPKSTLQNNRLVSINSRQPASQTQLNGVSILTRTINLEPRKSAFRCAKLLSVNRPVTHKKQTSQTCTCLDVPEMESMCLCRNEIMKKFIPTPGSYLQKIKLKLVTMQNRKSNRNTDKSMLSTSHSSSSENEDN